MTRSIDQAPNNNPDNNGGDDEHRNHPELVSRGSQSLLGGEIPANLYEPAPLDRDPRHKTRRNLIIAGSALAFTGIASTALYFGAKSEVREIANEINNPLPGNSAPVVPGQESADIPRYVPGDYDGNGIISPEEVVRMSDEEFAKLDLNSRIHLKGEELKRDKPEAYRIYSGYLDPKEREVMYLPDEPFKRGQDYLNNYAIEVYLSSIQAPTPEGTNNGRKLLSVAVSPDSPGFENLRDMIGNNPGISNVYKEIFTNFNGDLQGKDEFMGHPLNGLGGYLVYSEYVQSGDRQYMLFINHPGPDNKPFPVMTDIYSGNEKAFLDEVASLGRRPS